MGFRRLLFHLHVVLAGVLCIAGALPLPAQNTPASEILGVTIEPGERVSRLTIRTTEAVRPTLTNSHPRKMWIDLPGAIPGSLPPELPLDAGGVRSLRVRRGATGVRLELELERPVKVRLVSRTGARDLVVEIGEERSRPGLLSRPVEPATLTPFPPEAAPAPPDARPELIVQPRDTLPAHPSAPPHSIHPPAPPPGPAETARLLRLAIVPMGNRVQLKVTASSPCRIRHGYLPGSTPRCFIDVEGAVLGGLKVPGGIPRNSLVRGIRLGQNSTSPPIARIVLDLKPGTREEAFLVEGFQPAVLVDPEGKPLPLPVHPELPPSPPADPGAGAGKVIAIDAGHGGGDPGALGPGGMQEKDVTLDVALRLSRWLRERGCQVRLSRRSDVSMPPPVRTAWVRQTASDVLVSLHCDSVSGRPNVTGVTTYFHRAQSACRALAEKVQQYLVRATNAPDLGVRSDYTLYDRGLYILRCAERPAVLVETGYISHAGTAKLLAQPDYRQKLAEGVGEGVLAYLSARSNR